MVVKEDGSKWACSSCLKGHRVSGCQHIDRELTLVPKKGRPVTQCQHCRQERKKRSAHVSCDCGSSEKQHHSKEKCIHLRDAEERAKAGHLDDQHLEKDPAHLAAVAEEQGCCCHHGGKCTCAILKQETDDDVAALHGPAVKPRLEKTISDTSITVFTNGHHKPVHRKNHAAHECGMPYKIPMPRFHTEDIVGNAARRSVDSLALDNNMPYQPSAFAPQTSAPFNTERRKSKSEQPSPRLSPIGQICNGPADSKLNSIDFTTLTQTQTNQSIQSTMSESFGYPSYDNMSGATDNTFDWSAAPSADPSGMPNNNYFGVWPTSSDNSNMGQPALTAASSGTTSEIDEMPQMEDAYGVVMPSIQEDVDFDLINLPSGNSPQANRRSLPPGFFGNLDQMMPGMYPEFQTSVDNVDTTAENKPRDQQSNLSSSFDETWQMPARQLPAMSQRALGGLPAGNRLQSRSLGPADAPGDEIIRQLFPDIDINSTNTFRPTSSPQMDFSLSKITTGPQMSAITSSPVDFSPMDADVGFTSQGFSDGSMTIPNDTFGSPYEIDQDFSSQDFTGNWSQ